MSEPIRVGVDGNGFAVACEIGNADLGRAAA